MITIEIYYKIFDEYDYCISKYKQMYKFENHILKGTGQCKFHN